MQLIRYEAARRALSEARSVDEAKDIADKAAAMAAYARQANDTELERWAGEIRLRAKRRVGEISATLEKTAGPGRGNKTIPNGGKSFALKNAGLSTSEAHRCERLAQISEDEFDSYLTECREQKKVASSDELTSKLLRGARVSTAPEIGPDACTEKDLQSLVERGNKFSCIYADPPWLYGNQGTRAATGNHYEGLAVEDICALPISDLAADNAHLHLWTTNAFLFEAQRVVESWGFTYKSCFVWVKPQMGIGNYWRVSHEFLLFAVRGNCPFLDKSLMSWGEFDRTKHSAKPEQVRHMIEKASPGPRLELFGRSPARGWTVWGNQIERGLLYQEVA